MTETWQADMKRSRLSKSCPLRRVFTTVTDPASGNKCAGLSVYPDVTPSQGTRGERVCIRGG
jgi:hypothetical protein